MTAAEGEGEGDAEAKAEGEGEGEGRSPVGAMKQVTWMVVAAAVLVAAGLSIAGSVSQTAGGVVLVLGWLGFVVALHRYGRVGSS